MKIAGTIVVTGKLGPHSILTEEAVRTLHERLTSGDEHLIPIRAGGSIALARVVAGTPEVVELTPDQYAVRLEAELDELPPPPELQAAERLSAAVDAVLDAPPADTTGAWRQ